MTPKLNPDEVKNVVREGYARAANASGGCCGSTDRAKAERLASRLGYDTEQLNHLPADAVQSAFGCGNPVAFADVRAGQVVLDIGSGAGIDCLLAAEKVGPTGRVIGLDMTPEMIAKAWRNAVDAGATNVEFRLGDAEAMPVADASVDWVISNCVINLAPDKARVFREIARVLRPGGRVSISDMVLGEPLPPEIADDPATLVGCIGGAILETEYLDAVREAGLVDVEVTDRVQTDSDCGCDSGATAGKIWSARITARKP